MRLRLAALFALAMGIILLAAGTPSFAAETATPATPTASAGAPADSAYSLVATLKDLRGAATPADGKPVPGVTITVEDSKGAEVGSGVSDAAGKVSIPLPSAGKFTATLDEKSLPEGTSLSGKTGNSRTFQVLQEGPTFLQFPIGNEPPKQTGKVERLIDGSVSGIKFGLIIALAALGLSLIFGTTGLTNFAHGELITFGALVAYGFNRGMGMTLILAGVLAVIVSGFFGYANERLLWRPLRKRGTGLVAMMIVSIGLGLFLRNIYQYVFGGGTKSYDQYVDQIAHTFGPIHLANKEIAIMLISVVTIAITCVALVKTRIGKATRAVADNPALASSSGMRVDGVIAAVWIFGGAITGLSGVLLGVDQQVDFQMGFKLLLLVFAATTLGGLGTTWGALIGSIVVGLMVEVSPVLGVPSELKYVTALVVLILILLVRPQGILGRRERVG
ncbi:MAG: branched-chain amino acid transporter permease [Nocardioidaceae bacterium]|nr:branched-chain amino acid transporter permease [Nocardioidaceae bacterium]